MFTHDDEKVAPLKTMTENTEHKHSTEVLIVNIIPVSAGITGFANPAKDYTQLELSLDELLVEHPSSTFLGRVSGHSMEDVGIFDGDILIVDRHIEVQHMDVIVGNLNGEFVCKMIDTHQQRLVSANQVFPDVTISHADQFTIEGVVTRSIRLFRPSALW